MISCFENFFRWFSFCALHPPSCKSKAWQPALKALGTKSLFQVSHKCWPTQWKLKPRVYFFFSYSPEWWLIAARFVCIKLLPVFLVLKMIFHVTVRPVLPVLKVLIIHSYKCWICYFYRADTSIKWLHPPWRGPTFVFLCYFFPVWSGHPWKKSEP